MENFNCPNCYFTADLGDDYFDWNGDVLSCECPNCNTKLKYAINCEYSGDNDFACDCTHEDCVDLSDIEWYIYK